MNRALPGNLEIRFTHSVVHEDDASIQSVSELIYPLFSLEPESEGKVSIRMAGCSIEEVPIIGAEYTPDLAIRDDVRKQIFVCDHGELEAEVIEALELQDVEERDSDPDWLKSPSRRDQLSLLASQVLEEHSQFLRPSNSGDNAENPEFQLRVVWAKRIDGKLLIESDSDSATIKFTGWAKTFTNGRAVCPPFLCTESGKSSYRISVAPIRHTIESPPVRTIAPRRQR